MSTTGRHDYEVSRLLNRERGASPDSRYHVWTHAPDKCDRATFSHDALPEGWTKAVLRHTFFTTAILLLKSIRKPDTKRVM
ncbi:unnamed protein product [Boreogadus saida]